MYAKLKNYRQAPRKVRSVTDLVKGKTVAQALTELTFVPKKASLPIKKLIASAFANANQKGAGHAADALIVKEITVNKGMTFTRYMPRARGRASMINKESSHIEVSLSPKVATPAVKEQKTAATA